MNYIKHYSKEIHIYFLPVVAFFLLISTAVSNIFTILVVLSVFFQIYKRKDYKIIFEKNILIYSILIFLLMAFSSLYSVAETSELLYTMKKYAKFLLIPIFYYYLKVNNNAELVIKYFISSCTIILFLSYAKYFNLFDFNYFYYIFNFVSTEPIRLNIVDDKAIIFQSYINHGTILSTFFLLSLLLGYKKNSKIYYLLALMTFINILFLADSRSAYLITILLLLLFTIKTLNNKFLFIISFFIIISLFFTAINSNFVKRIEVASNDIFKILDKNDIDSSIGYRYFWANVGFDVISKKPILGNGVGSFQNSVKDYYKENDHFKYIPDLVGKNPHNEFISIASQLGLLGLILFILFLRSLYKTNRYFIFSNAVFITVFFSCLSNSVFYDNILGIFIIILICISSQDKSIKFFEAK